MIKWKVDENKDLPVAVIEDTPEGYGICELEGGGASDREELEKIAALISASPELLALVKDIVNASDNGQPYSDSELKEICMPIINLAEPSTK